MINEKCAAKLGIELLIIGIFLWLNDMYTWFSWPQFIAILFVIKGLIMLFHKGKCGTTCCEVPKLIPKPRPKKKKRR